MGGEWERVSLGKICHFKAGAAFKKEHQGRLKGDYPFIKVSDMNLPGNEFFIRKANNWIDEELVQKTKAPIHPAGAIVFAKIGIALTYNRRRRLTQDTVIDNNMMSAVPNPEIIDPGFLYFLFCQIDFNNIAEGSALPYLKASAIKNIKVDLPPIYEQRVIAYILGSLNDKIELNRQMNETLEAMARTIFKSWFVDFDPVRAKAEGRDTGLPEEIAALFPDSFEDSELGKIPRGWEVKVLGEIATTALGGQWGKEKPGKGLVPAICLRGCDMEDLRNEGYAPKAPVRFMKESAIEKRLPRENDLLIAASGAGPCGRPLWCSPLIKQNYKAPVIYSNFVKRFSTPGPEYAVYLDRLFYEKFLDKSIQDFITGTSVPNLDSKGLMAGFQIVFPPKKILKVFYTQNQTIFEKLYSVENFVLSKLRDTLLPKLISGELRVPDIDKFFEEAGL